jgi:hypothetical protein
MSFDEIVNHGSSSWKLVTGGQISPDVAACSANAVPNVNDWQSLTGLRPAHQIIRRFLAPWYWPLDNHFHVEITVVVYWQPGGRYRGAGAFIPNIWAVVEKAEIGMGWGADFSISIHRPTNEGTSRAPVAAVPITLQGEITSGLVSRRKASNFLILGTGDYENGHDS